MTIERSDGGWDASRRRVLGMLGAGGLCAVSPWTFAAQSAGAWPERPINYVVPFPPGGLTDVAARQVGKALSDAEKWNVVVENKPGGSANIGASHVARAAADGYTWLAITLTHVANVTLFESKAGYDLMKDLTPIAGLASCGMMVVVNPKSDIKTLDDLTRVAKTRNLSAGSSGSGTPPHLALALFESLTGVSMTHAPYKGGAPSLVDLMGGHLDVIFSNYPESLPHVKSGALRALAVTAKARTPDLPDVPTVGEAGMPGLIVDNFTGVLAPANTPPHIVQQAGKAIVEQMSRPEMKQAMVQLGFAPQPRGPAEFRTYLDSEVVRWRKIIQDAKISVG
ncbi:Bug family tripartite tricarboxylate transporter substrate binding protein [Pigmentiphaga litoralis]|uniref:Tripartite-type tricarboxylate transporter receptor subunit TctC n=1 Tax=Pigmentiphaga litoralis TaxID=516702 RepID=A0A7Y9ITE8_9BURK|nr:tripartite tricarboxylate transporter substrate binding protein [Pigmentiphaga litoralis]NYE23861.1 tripartite-type tricarboxylate transporter receptor subunit TctC [Pigmentiphaga litoralis]NYE82525.1 tripartite-type tricarboxylate transporter receptor subunit TctC [Pigmentiphaga litoralis]